MSESNFALGDEEVDFARYETFVHSTLSRMFPGNRVRQNVRIYGTKSGVERQVDIVLEQSSLTNLRTTAVECKNYRRKLHVKDIEQYIGMLGDLAVDGGLLVTPKGFTAAALSRVSGMALSLALCEPAYLSPYHSFGGCIPYGAGIGAVLQPPHTWLVDNGPQTGMLCAMYPFGYDLESAQAIAPFVYVNICEKSSLLPGLPEIAQHHESLVKVRYDGAKFEWIGSGVCVNAPYRLRKGEIADCYRGNEYTAYIDHPHGVVCLVLLCPNGQDSEHLPTFLKVVESCALSELQVS